MVLIEIDIDVFRDVNVCVNICTHTLNYMGMCVYI